MEQFIAASQRRTRIALPAGTSLPKEIWTRSLPWSTVRGLRVAVVFPKFRGGGRPNDHEERGVQDERRSRVEDDAGDGNLNVEGYFAHSREGALLEVRLDGRGVGGGASSEADGSVLLLVLPLKDEILQDIGWEAAVRHRVEREPVL